MRFHPVLALLSALAVGGTATAAHPPDVASAAHRFADEAEHLHQQIHRTPGHAHEGIDSHRLAEAAEHFHKQVERGGSRRHLGHDLEELRKAYRHLQHEVRRTGLLRKHRHVADDYRSIHHAFQRLENAVSMVRHRHRGYGGNHGYSRRGPFPRPFR